MKKAEKVACMEGGKMHTGFEGKPWRKETAWKN